MITAFINQKVFCRMAVAALFAYSLFSSVSAQLPLSISNEIKGLALLETDRESVKSLLSRDSFTVFERPNSDEFFRENFNIQVVYSSGECRDTQGIEDAEVLGPDVWNLGFGKVVRITIEPKVHNSLSDLGLDLSKFKKERRFPDRKNFNVYFNKAEGMAIFVRSGGVDSIQLFPQKKDNAFLCNSGRVRQHYRSNKWRLQAEPKIICVLISLPPNVTDLLIRPISANPLELEVSVKAEDPENDVLSYIYKVSDGHIVGQGAKVVWNLSDEKPGTYTIISAADDGTGPRGKFLSKTVVVP